MKNRRQFMRGTIRAGLAAIAAGGERAASGDSMETVRLLGVPLRSGSLYPGTENDAKGYRDAGLVELLRGAGLQVIDDGDLDIPGYLPHHSTPPIRNWPGPRIVWDLIGARVEEYLQHEGALPVLLGCDCSIVAGTARALMKHGDVHVIYIDGDFDDAPPDAGTTRSGAALAVWLLTNPSPFYFPLLAPENVTVVGWTNGPFAGSTRVGSISLRELRERGPGETVRGLLQRIPRNVRILVHFDVDVIRQSDLPAVYFPHKEGLSLQETGEIMDAVLSDERVRLMEVSEYAVLRDTDGQSAARIGGLLAHGLERRRARLTAG